MSLYGFSDDSDKELQSSNGSKIEFGLNQGFFLATFKYEPNGGKDGTPGDCIQVEFKKNLADERGQNLRFYPIERVYKKGQLIDESDPDYNDLLMKEVNQQNAAVVHILSSFVDRAVIKNALGALNEQSTFADYAQACERILPANFQTRPVDLFFHYQWNIRGEASQTYLELPRNMKGGYFCCAATPGEKWESKIDEEGKLFYLNDAGAEHIFTRFAI